MRHVLRPFLFGAMTIASLFMGCATAPPPKPLYNPNFSFSSNAPEHAKIGMTLGIVNPQYGNAGKDFAKLASKDPITKRMVSSLESNFEQLLIRKGFDVSGPFDSVDDMTFPQKQGADLVVYPEFNLDGGYSVTNVHRENVFTILGTQQVLACDVNMAPAGTIDLVAVEPLTGQKMWVKHVKVSSPPRSFPGVKNRNVCTNRALTPKIHNAWAQTVEQLYKNAMTRIDNYVSPQEFQQLDKQVKELRARKRF